MKQPEIDKLQRGDCVRTDHGHSGRIVDFTENYVSLDWRGTKRGDVLSRTSPLWQHIHMEKPK